MNRLFHVAGVLLVATLIQILRAEPNTTVDGARAAGLAFLAQQQADDGSFADGPSSPEATGWALLSFLASGHVQDQGRHGLIVRRAVQFLVRATGDATDAKLGRPVSTLALIEAFGVEPDPRERIEIRFAIERAVGRLNRSNSADDDLPQITWKILALRAARKIATGGVSQQDLDHKISSLMTCFDEGSGGFRMRPGAPEASPQATAAAVLALTLVDAPQRPEVMVGLRRLQPTSKPFDVQQPSEVWFLTIQAGLQDDGENWKELYDSATARLIATQGPDGSWPANRDELTGRVHSTCLALLTLSAPSRVLPSLQR